MSKLTEQQQHQIAAATLRRYEALQRDECLDPFDLNSRPTEKQLEVLKDIANYSIRAVIAGNQSGKSVMGGREVSWIFQDNNPYLERPKEWGTGPLLILVIGQVGEQLESNLWNRKIKPFLEPGTYKEIRIGNALQRVVHKENGNTIIFISHHNANEARKTTQGYVANYVWLDEMPNSISLVAELQTRIIAKHAKFLMTFTPLLKNIEIKNLIENLQDPYGKKYNFCMLDNPVYKGREQQILAQYANYPEAEKRARLYGEWFSGSNAVYDIDIETTLVDLPKDYSKLWEHVESVDPAASGTVGYILLARNPKTYNWIIVKAMYIDGAAASELLDKIEEISKGYNIIKRVSDPHEVWFIKEAEKRKRFYIGVFNKSQRKNELIKGIQESMNSGLTKIYKKCQELLQEISSCEWSETTEDKIVNSSKYHLLDSFQYAVDNLPKPPKHMPIIHPDPVVQHDMELRVKNNKRKEVKNKVSRIKNNRRRKWMLQSC